MITYRELVNTFRGLNLPAGGAVILHAAFSSFGDEVRGGPDSLIGALLSVSAGVMAPAFTYKPLLIPETGPENNACEYGKSRDNNRMAEFYTPDLPADALMGITAEALRLRPGARRSIHPLLSFVGIDLDPALEAQTLLDPFAPLRWLMEREGTILLLGVDQRVNTSIHLAESLAGRKQFLRWALTPEGVRACPHFPGCSEGFNQAQPYLSEITRWARVGEAHIQAIPLREMVERLIVILRDDPLALLCERPGCECCSAVLADLQIQNLRMDSLDRIV